MRISVSMLMVAAVLACLPTAEMGPVQQQEFCTAIIEAEFAFAGAIGERNQVRRNNLVAETREARRAEIERLIGDGAIEDWEVIVARVTDHMVGGIKTPQLQLELGCDAVLLTVNDLNAARGYLAAIEIGSGLYVSGELVVDHGDDYLNELSTTEAGSLARPQFGFRLTRLHQ